MEGGAWCRGDECSGWWGYRSTWVDPDVMPPDAMASTGYFNRSDASNAMRNWNFVFIRYCDGWSFSSFLNAPFNTTITNASGSFPIQLHMRGLAVLAAVQQELLAQRGMGAASMVVVGGCSAGGMAVYLHCDRWAAAIAAANPAAKVRCLADSGWFPVVPAAGFPSTWFNGVWQGGYTQMNATAALSPACLAEHAGADAWLCNMPEVAARYIKTPLFAFQSVYDSFQIFNMERCIPMPPDPASPCSNAVVTLWGGNITQSVQGWLASPLAQAAGSAAFTDSCYHHCGTWADFSQIRSFNNGNVTGAQAFASWVEAPSTKMWSQPHPYPCLGATCCGAHGPDS